MSSIDDYITRHTMSRRQDYDRYIHHLLDLDKERERSFGLLVNPMTGHVKYQVTKADEKGLLVTHEYSRFRQAYDAYVEGAGRENGGLHLVH